jgi:hypothetical protein
LSRETFEVIQCRGQLIASNGDQNHVIRVNSGRWNHSGRELDPLPVQNVQSNETVACNLASSPPVVQHRDGDSPGGQVGTVDRTDHTRSNK